MTTADLSTDARRLLDWAQERGEPFTADDAAPALFPGIARCTLGLGALFNSLRTRGLLERTGRKVYVRRLSQAGSWYETAYLPEWGLTEAGREGTAIRS